MSAIINGIEVLTPSDLKKISQILPQVTATDSLLLVVEQTDGTGANTSVGSIRATLIPATQKGLANGVATLGADGKIPASQLPALAVVDVYPAESEAQMLALDAQQGDMAIRSDLKQAFILAASPASTLSNWVELSGLKALVDAAIAEVKGTGYTEGSLKTHEDRLDTLEGTGEGSVADDIAKYAVKLTKMPDGATAVYSQDAWATVDGWSSSRGDLSVANGVLTFLHNATAGNMYMSKTIASIGNPSGKTFAIKIYANKAFTLELVATRDGAYAAQKTISVGTVDTTYFVTMPVGTYSSNFIMQFTGLTVDSVDYVKIDFIWVGDYSYLANSISTEASRISNQLGDTAGVGTKASGIIVGTTTIPTVGKKVSIAGKTYTFVSTLTGTEGEVLILGTYQQTIEALWMAITRYTPATYNYGGAFQRYSVASSHPLVDAKWVPNSQITLLAKTVGLLGNSITMATDEPTFTLSGSTLTGGTDDVGAKVITQLESSYKGTPKFNGVAFPATAVASSDPNTLDDYEEGMWTPTITIGGSSVGITYGSQIGRYTKIGRLVTVKFTITLTNKGSNTAYVYILGLPFAPAGEDLGIIRPHSNFAGLQEGGFIGISTTTSYLITFVQTSTGQTTLNGSNLTNTSLIMGSITYTV